MPAVTKLQGWTAIAEIGTTNHNKPAGASEVSKEPNAKCSRNQNVPPRT